VLYLAVNGTKDEVLDSCVELPARLKNATDYQEKAEERAAEFELYKVRINNAKRKAQANLKNYFLNTIKKLDMDKFVTQKEFAQKVTEILERGFSGGEIKNLDYDSCFIVLKGNKSITQAFEGYQLYLKDVENKSNVDKIALDEMKKVIENFISKIEAKVIKENTNVLNAYQNNINQNETTFALNTTIEKTIAGLTIKNPFVNNGEPVFLEEKYQLAFKDTEKFGDTKVVSAAGTLSIYNDEFLDKLESQDPTTRNNAIKDLINAGLTAIKKLEGYNFYPKAKQGNQPVLPLNLDKNSETYKALSKVGKYLEYPELEPKLIDLDLHKKALALDKNIIDLLPDVGAKIIIHGTLFGGNPKYDECKFASKEFSDFCNYLKENVEKLDLKSVTYDNHESVVYSAGELVKHARGEGDPFLDHWTGPNISEEKRNILNKGFIFDKIIRSTDSSYTYQKENLRRDQTGVTLARSRISSFTGNDNKYLQYINK
jgi:hypothetical protein